MKYAENYIAINIKLFIKTPSLYTGVEFMRRYYVTTVNGDRLEVDGDTWYLWYGSYLITSGSTRDLHEVHNHVHNGTDGAWNDIELDYTPIYRL